MVKILLPLGRLQSPTIKMNLASPRYCISTFDPHLIAKYQSRFSDFDDKVISMHARDRSVREIHSHRCQSYVHVWTSPDCNRLDGSGSQLTTTADCQSVGSLSQALDQISGRQSYFPLKARPPPSPLALPLSGATLKQLLVCLQRVGVRATTAASKRKGLACPTQSSPS
jgi:hypothetical protein